MGIQPPQARFARGALFFLGLYPILYGSIIRFGNLNRFGDGIIVLFLGFFFNGLGLFGRGFVRLFFDFVHNQRDLLGFL